MPDQRTRFALLGAGLGIAFLSLSVLVNRATFAGIDHAILFALRGAVARRYHAILSTSSFIGSPEFTLLIVCVVFAYVYIKRRRAPIGLSLFFALFAVEFWGKSVLFHPDPPAFIYRPNFGPGSFPGRLPSRIPSPISTPHFPSSIARSAMVCAAILIAVALVYFFARRRRLWIGLSVLFVLIAVGVLAVPSLFSLGPFWYAVRHSPALDPLRLLVAQMESSFPSGHMARTTFVCVILLARLDAQPIGRTPKVLGALLAGLFVLGMSVSLMSLGYHWFSDVLGGLALGASFASLALWVDGLEDKTSTPEAIRTPAPGSGGRCSIH